MGRQLSWERDDLALQNIQARARGPSVWLLANIRGALLLATSNRSEAAVGYATMDGDTCGGLSPIAGIDKAFLRRWLVWLEKEGPAEHGPMPALSAVNVQEPTAELRPSQAGQTDESDLMPYEVLDVAERAAIRDKKIAGRGFSAATFAIRKNGRRPIRRRQIAPMGAGGFSASGAATSGNANDTRHRSTSTTKTSTQKHGAGSQSFPADSNESWENWKNL